jgi:hypothetical protein
MNYHGCSSYSILQGCAQGSDTATFVNEKHFLTTQSCRLSDEKQKTNNATTATGRKSPLPPDGSKKKI